MAYQISKKYNDTLLPYAWYVIAIDLLRAHKYTKGSPNVAFLGGEAGVITENHPDFISDLSTIYKYPLWAPTTERSGGQNQHGAIISAICGARENNAGLVGIAPSCLFLDTDGIPKDANNYTLRNEIAWVLSNNPNAKMIKSASASWTSNNVVDQAAISEFYLADKMLYFKSSGNQPIPVPPGSFGSHVFAVGATVETCLPFDYNTFSEEFATFSAYGCEFAMPGQKILGHNGGLGYYFNDGTSFAAPMFSAVAALVWSANLNLSAATVLDIIAETANTSLQYVFQPTLCLRAPGSPNVYRAVLKALSLLPENSNTLFPSIVFKGAFSGEEAYHYIDPETMQQEVVLDGPCNVELQVYGQNWTANGQVQFYADDELLYSGPPTKIVKNTTFTEIDAIKTTSDINARVTGSFTYKSGTAFISPNPFVGLGSDGFQFDMNFSGANTFVFDIDFISWDRPGPPGSGTLDISIGTKHYGSFQLHDDITNKFSDKKFLNVIDVEGVQTVKFIWDTKVPPIGPRLYFSNFIATPDYVFDSGFIWNVQAPENRILKLVATDGALTKTVYFQPDFIPPTTSTDILAGTYPKETMISLAEVGTDLSQPITIRYRWNSGPWQTYTEPFIIHSGLLEFQGFDSEGNYEAIKSVLLKIISNSPILNSMGKSSLILDIAGNRNGVIMKNSEGIWSPN